MLDFKEFDLLGWKIFSLMNREMDIRTWKIRVSNVIFNIRYHFSAGEPELTREQRLQIVIVDFSFYYNENEADLHDYHSNAKVNMKVRWVSEVWFVPRKLRPFSLCSRVLIITYWILNAWGRWMDLEFRSPTL